MESHLETGRIGEEIACRLLEQKGMRILERNWRHRHLEVDIIAEDRGELVLVEVKVRSQSGYETALEAVDQAKQAHLIAAANAYIKLGAIELSVRYDIVAIELDEHSGYTVEHVPQAFFPTLRRRPKPKRYRST